MLPFWKKKKYPDYPLIINQTVYSVHTTSSGPYINDKTPVSLEK